MPQLTQRIQTIELQSYKFFRDLCQKNHLKYFALGGTLLGAIRHHGFIPWDDDMDIGLPREDYEKLLQITSKELNNTQYFFQTPFSDNNYALSYGKLLNRNTYIEEKNNYNDAKKGVFIDVFPIDKIPSSPEKQRQQYIKIKRLDSRLYLRLRYNFIDNPIKRFYSPLNEQQLAAAQDFKIQRETIMRTYNNNDDLLLNKNLASQYEYDAEVFTTDQLNNIIEVPFEDTTIPIFADYHTVLTNIYDDYMSMPPENQQVSKHISLLIMDNQQFTQ
ncbi:LicD family protein [Lentilactobacillus kosonis]|uniref:Lipopolysaccharide cholinephosphotransferase LicD1 n=1 Tax=Lentilactobacillus kosonis TaxID=2810561 RepID=A0A401FK61_9LACO|nr:LicD family protein [Lentilactobacillus kosonis]GAY72743.1 lipopolysaccharide cholinephosphotransferase LicD1 [Lentilactobacillus kosonis]